MIISTEKPEIYPRIQAAFGDVWDKGVLITYGDTVHVKKGGLSPDLRDHEQVHIDRQAIYPGGGAAWWDEYLANPKFRLDEELIAYQKQAKYIRAMVSNPRKQEEKLEWIRKCLSDSSYGNMVTYEEIRNLI